MKKLLLLSILVFVLVACVPASASSSTPDVSVVVNETLTAVAQPQPTDVPPGGGLVIKNPNPGGQDYFPNMGTITGNLSYPADRMPAVRIVAYNVSDMSFVSYSDTALDQSSYQFELPEGTYYIVVYLLPSDGFPGGFAAGYTQAVLCSLGESCTDHTLVPVTVKSGETLTDINPIDWSYDPSTYPLMPN